MLEVLEVLCLTDSSCPVCSRDRSATIGSLMGGSLLNFSCCRRREFGSSSAAGSGIDKNSLTFWTNSLKAPVLQCLWRPALR